MLTKARGLQRSIPQARVSSPPGCDLTVATLDNACDSTRLVATCLQKRPIAY